MLTQKQLSHMVIQKNQNLIYFDDFIMKNKKGHIKSVPVRIQQDIVGKRSSAGLSKFAGRRGDFLSETWLKKGWIVPKIQTI